MGVDFSLNYPMNREDEHAEASANVLEYGNKRDPLTQVLFLLQTAQRLIQ